MFKIKNEVNILRENQIFNIKYIVENKEHLDKNIKINLKYEKCDRIKENYEINSEEIQTWEELAKLIINDYLINNKALQEKEEEKTELALKYQILSEKWNYQIKFSEK